ncbi:MazG nucleotide pyrophosphohydrolase domain-containing protein [Stenotrophomonas maltophilia]|uniref:MazG nucleotide pyrophosphohydrolase domain-containing protein n=3 Tax=Stenotrophomonas maltophilia TaxID=40324 RepID=UPI000B2FCB35|nr:MazG nucleotide pyrophosphohydrolase domain-containing protein [Stenotrophomonas maltophilia]MBH1457170.1 pyrophosphatase [Stenotrophomonas maltophilia]MBH1539306.1 pyrophosphatase [Stenotrophomonas maltophilia]MBH1781967.1 pyrophosphatase [Stenotrophomonas maltophilia]MBN5046526.1 pyrophosphatase [Stenotrophomonas maltophilia]MBN5155845.1 pyrophosphatase [Stenotrophomonas maltophilia]
MTRLKSVFGFDQYLSSAMSSNQFQGTDDELFKHKLGLIGEVGELCSGIKKAKRDALTDAEASVASEEIGDILWYLFAIAKHQKFRMSALLKSAINEVAAILRVQPLGGGDADVSFRRLTGFVNASKSSVQMGENEALQRAVGRAGALVSSPGAALPALAGMLADLALLTHSLNLDLEQVARDNVDKVRARWPGASPSPSELFDSASDQNEQLPRTLWVRFEERKVRTVPYAFISVNGINVGDRLTDNSHEADDYRFHDVFHLAYAACLGWSPVLRALLKRKRKSSPALDENEDGARAIIIEEAISTWMFNIGREHLFAGVRLEKFPYSVLKQVQSLVKGYEVEACQPWEWANAILMGFEVFRTLKEKRGGYVVADLNARRITYKGLQEVDELTEHKEVRRATGRRKPAKGVQPIRRRVRNT